MNDSWVMFGQSHFFGDIFDIITALGGTLKKVVVNVPEKEAPGRPTLRARLDRITCKILVEELKDFRPEPGEKYVVGFHGKKMAPLVGTLKERFGIAFTPLVHPTAIIQAGAAHTEGAVVDAGVILGSWATLDRHVVLSRGASVGHDCELGDYSFMGPGAVLCGHVRLGEDVFVGANATILPGVAVGAGAVIGAGAVVAKDVPAGAVMAGPRAAPRGTP